MRYGEVIPGIFLERPNRFIAHVRLGEETVVCHVKNTGRCRELLAAGARVWLARGENPARKTPFDLIAVEKGDRLINMDSQAPNGAAAELLAERYPDAVIRPEQVCGRSRFDFCLTFPGGRRRWVEVKGVTLEEAGAVFFPDAPTARGVKHLEELIRLRESGEEAALLFIVQMENVRFFAPNRATDPAFADALLAASRAGVEISAWECHVEPDSLAAVREIPVKME